MADKGDKAGKVLGPNDSGQEAYDLVLTYLTETLPRRKDWSYARCHGMARWRGFLQGNPNATLEQCLVEFEAAMRKTGDLGWPQVLLGALGGKVYPEFFDRVLDVLTPDGAASAISKRDRLKLSRDQIRRLEVKRDVPGREGVKAHPQGKRRPR